MGVIPRQQRAQELQRELGEVEVRQQELEQRGASVEKAIRGERPGGDGGGGEDTDPSDDAVLMRQWFGLVHERSMLVRRDQLLQLQLRELQLEDKHDRLQMELRERMAAPDGSSLSTRRALKSDVYVERERELVSTLLEISEQRRALDRPWTGPSRNRLRMECESAENRQ
ncbi:protein-methionine sulfoxide oxidase mical3b-like [Pollicipes pollicipes]|uniref:protein-methionine sulfoxide oxidase mical3b-like n=1 Tax=Pollicipes pollicipes TaxID=41117 RepID=UPI0018850142|nr:protein-methionine sulfoxide oxidase mical3b-like [Pollicipes pollicipes]